MLHWTKILVEPEFCPRTLDGGAFGPREKKQELPYNQSITLWLHVQYLQPKTLAFSEFRPFFTFVEQRLQNEFKRTEKQPLKTARYGLGTPPLSQSKSEKTVYSSTLVERIPTCFRTFWLCNISIKTASILPGLKTPSNWWKHKTEVLSPRYVYACNCLKGLFNCLNSLVFLCFHIWSTLFDLFEGKENGQIRVILHTTFMIPCRPVT